MKLYNSLTRTEEQFTPYTDTVRIYSCGPTVYNNLHIGNLAAFIYADLLRRTLKTLDYNVEAVMNVTDVDDKTIRDSRRDYPDLPPDEALYKLTRKYEQVFLDDSQRIGNDTAAITFIRATETIDDMLAIIQRLLDQGIAYLADDGVYFSITAYETTGHTYGLLQDITRSTQQSRITNDEYGKEAASDFALWKAGTPGEPTWPAIFTTKGKSTEMAGRPGWHIECSAMSEKLLGVPFDIHTGGIDLKFPHHENEIAQSCGANTTPTMARYFVHNNHVLIDGVKMSKSLGNVYTLRDIESRGYDPLGFRLLVISSHYSSESNFTWDILTAACNRLRNLELFADMRWQPVDGNETVTDTEIMTAQRDIWSSLADNMNTPQALAILSAFASTVDKCGISMASQEAFGTFLTWLDDVFGLDLATRPDLTRDQLNRISMRQTAKDTQDWQTADSIRNDLSSEGVYLNDTSRGQVWRRTP